MDNGIIFLYIYPLKIFSQNLDRLIAFFNESHVGSPPAQALYPQTATSGKQVNDRLSFDIILQYGKNVFFYPISSRAYMSCGRKKFLPFIFSGYDSHVDYKFAS